LLKSTVVVVGLKGQVVAAARNGDTVLRAGEFVFQAHELVVAF
jgi:hypothetical protein